MPLGTLPPCPPYLGSGGPGLSKAPLGGCPVCSKPLGGCGCPCVTAKCGYVEVWRVCENIGSGNDCQSRSGRRLFYYCCNADTGLPDTMQYVGRKDDLYGPCGLEIGSYVITVAEEGNYMFPPCLDGSQGIFQEPFLPPLLVWALSLIPQGESLC